MLILYRENHSELIDLEGVVVVRLHHVNFNGALPTLTGTVRKVKLILSLYYFTRFQTYARSGYHNVVLTLIGYLVQASSGNQGTLMTAESG